MIYRWGWWRPRVKNLILDDMIVVRIEYDPLFVIVEPGEWIVELGQCGPMKVLEIAELREMSRDSERLRWVESLKACLLEWMVTNDFVQLAIAIVSAVEGLKWNEFQWVWG